MAALDFILSAQQIQEGEHFLPSKPKANSHRLNLHHPCCGWAMRHSHWLGLDHVPYSVAKGMGQPRLNLTFRKWERNSSPK